MEKKTVKRLTPDDLFEKIEELDYTSGESKATYLTYVSQARDDFGMMFATLIIDKKNGTVQLDDKAKSVYSSLFWTIDRLMNDYVKMYILYSMESMFQLLITDFGKGPVKIEEYLKALDEYDHDAAENFRRAIEE